MSKENPNEFKIINKNERLKYRQTINELKQQLEEKDKEIEELKQNNKIFMQLVEETKSKNIDDFAFLVRVINGSYIQKLRKANRKVQEQERLQNQLAIQELEKVKDYICDCTYIKEPDYTNVRRKIDNQIKLLKGEKDVKD